jgi:hypothetical protein
MQLSTTSRVGCLTTAPKNAETSASMFTSLVDSDCLATRLPQPEATWKLCYDRRSAGQSVFVSNPICGPRPDFYYCQTVAGSLMWGALSDERAGLSFTTTAGTRQRTLGSKSRGTYDHILLSHIRGFHNLEVQVPVFIYPRNRVVQLYPRAPGSLSVAYD